MKISEYILLLDEFKKNYGDLEVFAEDEEYGKWKDIFEATCVKRPNEYFIQAYKNDPKVNMTLNYKEAVNKPYAVIINGR